jgi:hypothetical protein
MTRQRRTSNLRKTAEPIIAARGGGDPSTALSRLVQSLEAQHYGQYVMLSPTNGEYVIAPTVSEVHRRFIEAFGHETIGYCTRIGASPFASALM